jgi:hypothetical protein
MDLHPSLKISIKNNIYSPGRINGGTEDARDVDIATYTSADEIISVRVLDTHFSSIKRVTCPSIRTRRKKGEEV